MGRLMTSRYFAKEFGVDRIGCTYGLQISVAKVVLPNGDEVEGKGISPHIVCNLLGQDMHDKNDVCLKTAIASAREALHLTPAENQKVALEPAKN